MDLMDAFHIFHEYISEKISLQSGAGHFIILDMDRFLNEVLKNIRKYELIHRGQQVVVGFSGGADSVCLLHVLHELRAILGISELRAVHVNHCLRGDEALRDEIFSRDFCREHDIEFRAVQVDVKGLAASEGSSIEEAGRKLRYEALRRELIPGGVIATAHHADDSAETILLNLARGTGFKGAAGIRPKRDDVIRPLIFCSKSDILSYVESRGLSYVTDSTNLSNDYTRNAIRNMILPLFREHVNLRTEKHILDFGIYCDEADAYFTAAAEAFLDEEAELSQGVMAIRKKSVKEKAQIVRRYVIIEALRRLGVPLKDMTRLHFESVDAAFFAGNGYHVDLPGGVCVKNDHRETCIYLRED